MSREDNVKVFEHTEKMCKTNGILRSSVESSKKKQKIILESENFYADIDHPYKERAEVFVSDKRSFEAALVYAEKGLKVCVHNFASATNPGGGVAKGSNAQEEGLCRISTLYPCLADKKLWNAFYMPHRQMRNPLNNGDCIYTPDVVIFKSDDGKYNLLPQENWNQVNVITLAAPNLRTLPSNDYNPHNGDKVIAIDNDELLAIHEKRMRRFMEIAKAEGNEVVILGAFGCGAFMNNPNVVVKAMKNISEEYKYDFKVIEFAVYCRPDHRENYEIFKKIIG